MHKSALENYKKFLQKYVNNNNNNNLKVLEVGSCDVHGPDVPQPTNLRSPTIEHINECQYIGLDLSAGPNVDVVGNSHNIPFDNDFFDVVISSSCFEHDEMFWVTFKEMSRVIKPNGLIYIQAPSAGPYHGWPGDCWRFYKDSWKALEKWNDDVLLLESYIDGTDMGWLDSVGIYKKKMLSMKKKIIICPWSNNLPTGDNPKNFPYWLELVNMLKNVGYEIIQIGRHGEKLIGANTVLFDLSFDRLKILLDECYTFISVDSFFPHFAHYHNKHGIVIFGKSDPLIFGYKENINLLKDRKYLRKGREQFWLWTQTEYDKSVFVSAEEVFSVANAHKVY